MTWRRATTGGRATVFLTVLGVSLAGAPNVHVVNSIGNQPARGDREPVGVAVLEGTPTDPGAVSMASQRAARRAVGGASSLIRRDSGAASVELVSPARQDGWAGCVGGGRGEMSPSPGSISESERAPTIAVTARGYGPVPTNEPRGLAAAPPSKRESID